ncbi:MAG TPA: hypothetical protein VGJ21_20870 [Terracidiphilus sp.]|jgi:hypothetical protein
MRTDRWLIGALALLVGGIWLLLAWCHGNMGLNFAYPVDGTKLSFDVVSMGAPVLIGIPMIFLGLVLMAVALVAAIIAQFHRPDVAELDPITHIRFEE